MVAVGTIPRHPPRQSQKAAKQAQYRATLTGLVKSMPDGVRNINIKEIISAYRGVILSVNHPEIEHHREIPSVR